MCETTLSRTEIYRGRLIVVENHTVRLPDGRRSQRDIVRHPDAIAVVAELADGRFVMVRQYRKAIEQASLELPAGCLEAGETPAACARREIQEETGYAVQELTALGSVYSSPGFCDETLWLFHARLSDDAAPPQPDADEDIAVEFMTRDTLEAAMLDGRIRDAKTLAAWWLFTQRMPS